MVFMKKITIVIILFLIGLHNICSAADRRPVVAGTFYPEDPEKLRTLINGYLQNVPADQGVEGDVLAVIVPHAGYVYSGQTAAYGFKLLEGRRYDAVIIVGVSHRYGFKGISVWRDGDYKTPLGNVKIDTGIAGQLTAHSPLIGFNRNAHLNEHSVEVEVPFIQVVQPGVPIVPVLTGDREKRSIEVLGEALAEVSKGRKVVIVISTDLAHYVSRREAKILDDVGIDCIEKLDWKCFYDNLQTGKTRFCGGSGVAAVLKAAPTMGAGGARVLRYYDSGYATGDPGSIVSYLAAAITDNNNEPERGIPMQNSKNRFSLNENQKKILLEIAGNAITNVVKNNSRTPPEEIDDPVLKTKCGAFVTINKNGQLRGCIGYTEAFKPLYLTVHECAISAATQDPRFYPVTEPELDDIELEISVLSPLQKVENLEDIQVGRDGLMITRGMNRGLLLPQVASEYGWDRTTFLEQTCRKAGLPKDAYKDPDAVIQSFTAEVFDEH